MADMANERFYPVDTEAAYAALVKVLGRLHKVRSKDDFSKSVSFATRASGFSWGANFSAYVRPVEGGSIVSIGGAAKVRVNLTAKSAEFKRVVQILNGVSKELQAAR